jgi:sirohydrochlorin cobaltochelatase
VRAAASTGAHRIVVVPYFLSPGVHVRRDLTAIVVAARAELGVTIEISDFLGAHPEVPRLLAELARNALSAGVRS